MKEITLTIPTGYEVESINDPIGKIVLKPIIKPKIITEYSQLKPGMVIYCSHKKYENIKFNCTILELVDLGVQYIGTEGFIYRKDDSSSTKTNSFFHISSTFNMTTVSEPIPKVKVGDKIKLLDFKNSFGTPKRIVINVDKEGYPYVTYLKKYIQVTNFKVV